MEFICIFGLRITSQTEERFLQLKRINKRGTRTPGVFLFVLHTQLANADPTSSMHECHRKTPARSLDSGLGCDWKFTVHSRLSMHLLS